MEKAVVSLARAKSEQLTETTRKSLTRATSTDSATAILADGTSLSRKPSFIKRAAGSSPGYRSTMSHHGRKSQSAQLKLEAEDLSSGVALSRASSASLGFSFSFTGFTAPPDDTLANLGLSDDNDRHTDLEGGRWKKIMVEPTLPIRIKLGKAFKDVKYKVIIKRVTTQIEKEVLTGVTGSASPGEVLALMGPSGSGKTTLLSLLGGRTNGCLADGTISYNEQPFTKSLKRRIGFVTQDDVLFAHLTVKETLTYASLLRLPKTLTRQEKEERATCIISELELERCQDTMIGGPFVRGISGGERKRVCIGNEILINPSLLFLDEPTSGLDSTTALKIVGILRAISGTGKTVITTVHQPSSRLFHKFDKLILLGKGSLLYFGLASEALPYFASIGCSPLLPVNPAEFLLDLANGNTSDVSLPSELVDKIQMGSHRSELMAGDHVPSPKHIHEYLVETYEIRLAYKEKRKLLVPVVPTATEDLKAKVELLSSRRVWGANWWQQYRILFWRGLKERRHDYLSWMRITQVIATATVLGLLWWRFSTSTAIGLQDQAGLLFFIAVFWGFFPVFTAVFTFPQERAMLNKELAVDMYRLSAYFMARTTSDMPLDLFLPVIFLLIVYFVAGLRTEAASFLLTMLTVFLNIVAAQGLGLVIGATLMDIKKATTLASVTVMTFMLAGGFFVKRVPEFISWVRYISFNYHTYRLLLKVQYGHLPQLYILNVKLGSGLKEVSALVVMAIGYRLLAYVSLRRLKLSS